MSRKKPLENRISKGIHFFTPEVYEDSGKLSFTYRLLSDKELLSIEELFDDNRRNEVVYRTLQFSLIRIENIFGEEVHTNDVPFLILEELVNKIVEESVLSSEEADTIMTSLDIHFEDEFKSDTWSCETCRRKGLDKFRNCGYLDYKNNKEYYSPDFKLYVGANVYTHCPIFDIDSDLLGIAIQCYNIKEAGFLPDSGGYYDQTRIFRILSTIVTNKVAEQEKKQLEEMKKKMKNK